MASLFRRNPRAKLTSLFREVFAEIATQHPDEPMFVTITVAAEECGMTDYDPEAIAERLLALSEKMAKAMAPAVAEDTQSGPALPKKKTGGFGSQYTQWLGGLSSEKLCLWLADYDFDRAKALYCDTDIDDLEVMVALKSGHEWQLIRTQFEACVIGFGGKIEGQSDSAVHEVDMGNTQSVNDMIAQMRALGF